MDFGRDGTTKRCWLQMLPRSLLGRCWPEESVTIGLRLCKFMRDELLNHVEKVLLEAGRVAAERGVLNWQTLNKFQRTKVTLRIIGAGSALAFLSGIRDALENGFAKALNQLQVLNSIDDQVRLCTELASVLTRSSNLQRLEIQSVCLDEAQLSMLLDGIVASGCPLVALGLKDTCTADDGACHFSKLVQPRTLTALDLSENMIGSGGAAALCKLITAQESLALINLNSNRIGEEGASHLARALKSCSALTHLSLESNSGIGDDSAAMLVETLSGHGRMRELELRHVGAGAKTTEALGASAVQWGELSKLDLGRNGLGSHIESLATGIGGCLRLQTLLLENCMLGDQGAQRLVQGIRGLPRLAVLALDSNGIGAEGAGCLAGALEALRSLQQLRLAHNSIGAQGAGRLAAALAAGACAKLREVSLRANRLGMPGVMKVLSGKALQGGRALERLDLSENGASIRKWKPPRPSLEVRL